MWLLLLNTVAVADQVNQRELADFLGITDRQIRNLEKAGILGKRGRSYPLGECTRAYIQYVKRNASPDEEGSEDGGSLSHEEYRYNKLRNDKLQLQIEELERKLGPISLLESALSDVAGQLVATLETLAGRLKKRNPNLTDADLNLVRQEVGKLRNALASTTISTDDYYGLSEGDQ